MGIKDIVEKMWCEEIIFQDIISTEWTKAQTDLADKGDEAEDIMFDMGIEMINEED